MNAKVKGNGIAVMQSAAPLRVDLRWPFLLPLPRRLKYVTEWHSRGLRDALASIALQRICSADELIYLLDQGQLQITRRRAVKAAYYLAMALGEMPSLPGDMAASANLFVWLSRHAPKSSMRWYDPRIRLKLVGTGANVLWQLNRMDDWHEWLRTQKSPRIARKVNVARSINALHPKAGGNTPAWLAAVNNRFFGDLSPIALDGLKPDLSKVIGDATSTCESRGMVTVILTTYNNGPELVASVNSILNQTYRDIELVVIDDASQDKDIVQTLENLDARVRVIELSENGGTYRARNVGLINARGKFITFQDSDDWSHPRRIERHIEIMDNRPEVSAVVGYGVFMSSDMHLRDGWRPVTRMSINLLMRSSVVTEVGYFHEVRKGADSEYITRLKAHLGDGVLEDRGTPVALVRRNVGSLTSGDFAGRWASPTRTLYRQGWMAWHRQCKEVDTLPNLELGDRAAIPAPRKFRSQLPDSLNVHTIIALNCYFPSKWERTRLRMHLQDAARTDARVAVLNTFPGRLVQEWNREVWEMVRNFSVEVLVPDDQAQAEELVVLSLREWQIPMAVTPTIRALSLTLDVNHRYTSNDVRTWIWLSTTTGRWWHFIPVHRERALGNLQKAFSLHL